MSEFLATWTATPAASVVAGGLLLAILILCGRHRDGNRRTSRLKFVNAFMLGATEYTWAVIMYEHFFMKVPITSVIDHGFGEERIAWIFLFTMIEVAARALELFDRDHEPTELAGAG